MTLTGTDLLDLVLTPRRNETFRFDLLNNSNGLLGGVAVDRKSPPSLSNDATATIPRQLRGFRILPRTTSEADSPLFFSGEIDTLTSRVRPVHVVGPGGAGYEFNLGIMLFADAADALTSGGTLTECTLVDQCQILEQTLAESVSYAAGTNLATALLAQAAAAGIVSVSVDATTATLSAPLVALSGKDTRGGIMRDLCKAAAFLRPYFDNDGMLICRAAPNLATASAEHTYGPGTGPTGRVIARSPHSSTGLLRAPNRYVVRDTSARDTELVGVFDIPASAPHSFANRGFRVVRSEDVQGLPDQAGATAAAAALYAQDASVFATITFTTPIDSRHDTFDIVAFDGVNHIEHVWQLRCAAGSSHEHDIRRIY